jgi:hypothetical protein
MKLDAAMTAFSIAESALPDLSTVRACGGTVWKLSVEKNSRRI